MIHADDDTGDALRRLEGDGDDLSRPRNIDFTVALPKEDAAQQFAEHFRKQGYAASVRFSETANELP
jgi:hypothetical protein